MISVLLNHILMKSDSPTEPVYTTLCCTIPYNAHHVTPYYVCNIMHSSQLLDITPGDQEEEEGGHMDLDAQRKGKAAVIKTSTRQVGSLSLSISLSHTHTHFSKINFRGLLLIFSDIFPASHWTSGPSKALSWRLSGEWPFH